MGSGDVYKRQGISEEHKKVRVKFIIGIIPPDLNGFGGFMRVAKGMTHNKKRTFHNIPFVVELPLPIYIS